MRPQPWLVLLLTLSPIALAPCRKPTSDEEQIRAIVARCAKAAEDKKPAAIMDEASDDFRGPGGADKRDTRRVLTAYLLTSAWTTVIVRDVVVKVDGERATAVARMVLAQGPRVESIAQVQLDAAGAHRFDLELKKTDRWWIVGAGEAPLDVKELLAP